MSDYVLVITKNNQRPNLDIYDNETDYADVSTDETCRSVALCSEGTDDLWI